ncbi:MAG TPA: excinuclease ABC subunit UvrC [Leptospiraceae bacterium]|nr:excinuclease ABC subunit UvrC [Leptospiraceae bacterium]HMX34124.1 excinuclease ABC subunit UvrC [Leptospiraceae bacterium]HMY33601.1 excinuclease ABC subunit UvrC [Leptospiraceae bacterium]HMZ64924.1 excinuclease ABC subunit UvrC [Leptospiraceae bacterium]HNA05336.1 excinuclease ABC subunit UvrC [Leptospiraceae bacterium]
MELERLNIIKEKIKNLSDSPGCYLWKNEKAEVIYVGKAVRLADRVRSYLNPNITDVKTLALQNEIDDLDWIATYTEEEALILEDNLIKRYNPKYNIRLKDDKRYPFICVSTDEPFPMVYLTRRIRADKKKYFGPYTDVKATRDLLDTIHKVFPIRKTEQKLPLPKPRRPCLNFHIKRCLAPCQGNISEEEYRVIVDQIVKFLEGKKDSLLEELRIRMEAHSERLEFERALIYRNMIENIQSIQKRQTVINQAGGDEDIIAYAKREDDGQIVILEVRDGRMESKKSFALNGLKLSSDEEVFTSFLKLYYLQANFIPTSIVLPQSVKKDIEVLFEFLAKNLGFKPKLKFPSAGEKKALLGLAAKNAEMNLSERLLATKLKDQTNALKELKENLKLKQLPRVIECYDISHFQGTNPVASGVMFVDGKPYKAGYRRYIMKSYSGINDPGMMHEVIARRLQRLVNENESLPDLIVIDGGEVQLARATEAAIALDLPDLPMIGLAKKREEIYFPGNKNPYSFDINSPSMRLLRHLRDEAHRFGVSFHRERRNKSQLKTALDGIADLGIQRKKAILKYFLGKKKLANVNLSELKEIPGIGDKLALKIYESLNQLKK